MNLCTKQWLAVVVALPMILAAGSTATSSHDRGARPAESPGIRAHPYEDDLLAVTNDHGLRQPTAIPVGGRATGPRPPAPVPSPSPLPPLKVELAWATETAPESPRLPIAAAVDRDGHLYALDAAGARVMKLDSGGRLMTLWGSEGSDAGQFRFRTPHACADPVRYCAPEIGGGIAVDDEGRVYVADYANHRIQVFDPAGRLLAGWGGEGGGPGQLRLPAGIAVDGPGRVYVSDLGNHRVQVFDRTGAFLTGWGWRGIVAGRFVHPSAVAVDERGHVYVADAWERRIQQFDGEGRFVAQWRLEPGTEGAVAPVTGLAVDRHGHLYVADATDLVRKLDGAGQVLASWGGGRPWDVALARPVGIAVDADGAVYVADQGAGSLLKMRPLLPVTS